MNDNWAADLAAEIKDALASGETRVITVPSEPRRQLAERAIGQMADSAEAAARVTVDVQSPATAPRRCYWIPAEPWKDTGKWVPSIIVEDEPGHSPLAGDPAKLQTPWYWGTTYAEAKATADRMNLEDFGITETDMAAILLSSLRAQRREENRAS